MSSSDQSYAQATCEKCGATFQLLAERVKIDGSMVKCGKCGHSFLFHLPEHLKGSTTNPQAKLPSSAWGTQASEQKKPSKKETRMEQNVSTRLLNQSAHAKKVRRSVNVAMILLGLTIGSATQIKRLTFKDISFALKFGVSPLLTGLQAVKVHGEYFSSNPTLHFLKLEGTVYNHDVSPNNGANLMLTILSPSGEFIKKFPVICCQPQTIASNSTARFSANIEIDHPGVIGSYFLSDTSQTDETPSSTTTN